MGRDTLKCGDVQRWMHQILRSAEPRPPDPALVAHIATCEFCRGALALLAAGIIDLPSFTAPISSQQCAADLAAFVEQEQEQGSVAAIRTYPQVWWHLWTCEECADVYRATRVHLEAQQSVSQFQAAPHSKVAYTANLTRRARVLQVRRPILYQTLVNSPAVRAASRGHGGQRYVLAEQERAGADLRLSVQRQPNGEWQVDITHQPPPSGSLVLIFGEQHFPAHFNAQGRAVIRDLPFALLTAPDGPDLELELDTEEGA